MPDELPLKIRESCSGLLDCGSPSGTALQPLPQGGHAVLATDVLGIGGNYRGIGYVRKGCVVNDFLGSLASRRHTREPLNEYAGYTPFVRLCWKRRRMPT